MWMTRPLPSPTAGHPPRRVIQGLWIRRAASRASHGASRASRRSTDRHVHSPAPIASPSPPTPGNRFVTIQDNPRVHSPPFMILCPNHMAVTLAPTTKRGARQRTLDQARTPTGRGGWRPRAGRKPTGTRVCPRHRARPAHTRSHPVHVVLRTVAAVGRLRRPGPYHAIREALDLILDREDFRVVEISIQHNHIHLIVEADDRSALSRGMQGLAVSIARRINRALGREGTVFAHRYHATPITTPKQMRAVLAYVLGNWRRHHEDERNLAAGRAAVDPYSSGPAFTGWRDRPATLDLPADYQPLPTARATCWLLTTGWRRHRPLSVREEPGPLASALRRRTTQIVSLEDHDD